MASKAAKANKARARADPGALMPPCERLQHAAVVLLENPISATDGTYGRPYRVVDTLEAMEAAGTISHAMRLVGERFRADFALAQLDGLRAARIDRAGMGSGPDRATIGHLAESARRRVWAQIRAAGGLGYDGGECLWYVLGWQYSLRRWATERSLAGRRTSPQDAAAILRTALGVLAGPRD